MRTSSPTASVPAGTRLSEGPKNTCVRVHSIETEQFYNGVSVLYQTPVSGWYNPDLSWTGSNLGISTVTYLGRSHVYQWGQNLHLTMI